MNDEFVAVYTDIGPQPVVHIWTGEHRHDRSTPWNYSRYVTDSGHFVFFRQVYKIVALDDLNNVCLVTPVIKLDECQFLD